MDNLAIMNSQDTSLECEMVSSSCACLEEMEETVNECCTGMEWSPNNKMYMAMNDLKEATVADKTIQELLNLLQSGFPFYGRSLSPPIRPYLPLADALYGVDGVLMINGRIVIPTSLRPNILHLLHAAHQGTDRMKARATDMV